MPPNKQYLRQCNGKARREMAKHKRTSKYAVNAGKQEMPKMPTSPLKSDRQSNLQGRIAAIFRMLVCLKLSKGLNVSHKILLQLQIQKSALTSGIQQRSIVQCRNGHSQEGEIGRSKHDFIVGYEQCSPTAGPCVCSIEQCKVHSHFQLN